MFETYIVKETIEYTEWRQGDGLHRIHGPAMEWKNGLKEWWQKGKQHRDDGPAIIFPDGEKHWFLFGKRFSEKDFKKHMTMVTTIPIKTISTPIKPVIRQLHPD